MSKIVMDELVTTLRQDIAVKERLILSHIKLFLYLHNDPSGTFTISVKDGATTLGSASLTMDQIKIGASFGNNQYHKGMFRFGVDPNPILNPDTTYTLELSSSGYSFSESSYLAWVKEHENLTNTFNYNTISDYEKPFSFQLWGRAYR